LNGSVKLLAVEHRSSSPVSGLRQRLAVRVYIIGQGIKGQQVFGKRSRSFLATAWSPGNQNPVGFAINGISALLKLS
jgi:hypothetical protein